MLTTWFNESAKLNMSNYTMAWIRTKFAVP